MANETDVDVRVANNIHKMYMSDAQYELLAEKEQREKEGKVLTDAEYFALKCKIY